MDALIFLVALLIFIFVLKKYKVPQKPNFRQNVFCVFVSIILVVLFIIIFAAMLHFGLRFSLEIKSFFMTL